FAGTRFRGDARPDVKRETKHFSPAHFVLACVQPHPDLKPQRAHCLADCGRATDPGRRRVECREQSVPRRHDLFSAQRLQLSTDGGVVVIHHLCPTRIAQPRGFFGGPDDIDKQDCGERLFELGTTIGRSAPDRNISRQRFIAMAASPRDCVFYIVFGTLQRAATNSFLLWNRPVNLTLISHTMNLNGAPLQENRRANPIGNNVPNRKLRMIRVLIRVRDTSTPTWCDRPVEGPACRPTLIPCRSTINSRSLRR